MACELIPLCDLKPDEQAAWAQAILSVAAILAAALIARWQRKGEIADRHKAETLTAKSLAVALLRYAKTFSNDLTTALSEIDKRDFHRDGWRMQGAGIPQQIWESIPRLHELGAPGGHLLQAIYRLLEAREALQGDTLWSEKLPAYESELKQASKHAQAALAGMHGLLS